MSKVTATSQAEFSRGSEMGSELSWLHSLTTEVVKNILHFSCMNSREINNCISQWHLRSSSLIKKMPLHYPFIKEGQWSEKWLSGIRDLALSQCLFLMTCFCTQEEPHSRVLPRSRWATGLPLLLLHCSCWWLVILKIQQAFSLGDIALQGSCDVLRDGDVDECCQVLQRHNSLGITCSRKGNRAPQEHFSPVTCGSEPMTVSTWNVLDTGVLWENL